MHKKHLFDNKNAFNIPATPRHATQLPDRITAFASSKQHRAIVVQARLFVFN